MDGADRSGVYRALGCPEPGSSSTTLGRLKMPSRNIKWAVVSSVTLLAALAAFVAWFPSSKPRVSVAFVGWKDNDPETTYAQFAITNDSRRSIKPDSFLVEMPPSRFENPSYHRTGDGFIRPGQVETVTVLAPLDDGQWRLHLSFSMAGFHHTAARCYAGLFHDTRIYAATPDAIRFDPDYEVQTDWIKQ